MRAPRVPARYSCMSCLKRRHVHNRRRLLLPLLLLLLLLGLLLLPFLLDRFRLRTSRMCKLRQPALRANSAVTRFLALEPT